MGGTWLGLSPRWQSVCGHRLDRQNRAARDRKNILPHETPRERFQRGEDKERAEESMTNRNIRETPPAPGPLPPTAQDKPAGQGAEIPHSLLDQPFLPLGKTPPPLSSPTVGGITSKKKKKVFFPRASWNSGHLSHFSSVPNFSRPNLCCSPSALPPQVHFAPGAERFRWQVSVGFLFASISLQDSNVSGCLWHVYLQKKKKGISLWNALLNGRHYFIIIIIILLFPASLRGCCLKFIFLFSSPQSCL